MLVEVAVAAAVRGTFTYSVPAELAPLERATRAGQLGGVFRPDGSAELVAGAPGVDGALGRLVAIVLSARADG